MASSPSWRQDAKIARAYPGTWRSPGISIGSHMRSVTALRSMPSQSRNHGGYGPLHVWWFCQNRVKKPPRSGKVTSQASAKPSGGSARPASTLDTTDPSQ